MDSIKHKTFDIVKPILYVNLENHSTEKAMSTLISALSAIQMLYINFDNHFFREYKVTMLMKYINNLQYLIIKSYKIPQVAKILA